MKRGQDTNFRIMQAAAELFARKGYHATSITDITRKVGLTKSGLYKHVGGKSELVHKMIAEYRALVVDELTRRIDEEPGNAVDKLHRVISFMSEFGVNNLDKAVLMENLNNELKSDPEFASEFMAERDARQKCIKDVIRLGIRQGVMKKDLDADMAGAILFAMVSGMYQHWAVNRARIDGEQFVRMARKIFMEGVKS